MAAPTLRNMITPVVVILGSTGTGKSKLGLHIAQRLHGEIISADSMQIYKGLDIITNKVTPEERMMCRHEMIDFVDPLDRYTVVDYRNRALPLVDSMIEQGKMPVIVGGTNYYIESLLWKVLVDEEVNQDQLLYNRDKSLCSDSAVSSSSDNGAEIPVTRQSDDVKEVVATVTQDNMEAVGSEELHARLKSVDPVMADRLHPRNKRKIIRSLQVFEQHGKLHSDILREQRQMAGGSSLGGPLRYKHTCILWLHCEQAVLDERLDRRVDSMIQRGLIEELTNFHTQYNCRRLHENKDADYRKGIWQSIGFKEYHEFLMCTDKENETRDGQKLLQQGTEQLKQVTRKYARKQVKWILNRFLRRPDRQVPPVYRLDVTDPTRWEEAVSQPAEEIIQAFLEGRESPCAAEPCRQPIDNDEVTLNCDVCSRTFVGRIHWENHMKSRKHYKMKRAQLRAAGEGTTPASNKDTQVKDVN